MLAGEFLKPLEVTQVALAEHIGVPVQSINETIRGELGISSETAWLLSDAFETRPEFWVNLQSSYDMAKSRPLIKRVKKLQAVR